MITLSTRFRLLVPIVLTTGATPVAAQWAEGEWTTLVTATGINQETYGWDAISVGDVSGDGIGDFAVSAPLSSQGPSAGGRVQMRSGSDGALLWTRTGPLQSAILGYALLPRDWNGDGITDVFASAPFANGGEVLVFSGDTGATLQTFDGGHIAGNGFGASMALGDWDGDGIDDIAIASLEYDNTPGDDAGRVTIFSGASALPIFTIDGPTIPGGDAHFGTGLAFIGDVSVPADGRAELVIGRRDEAFADGFAEAWSFNGTTASSLYEVTGGMGYQLYSDRIDGGLDVDGDGFGDFVVGDVIASLAHVYSGIDGALLYTLDGDGDSGVNFGSGTMIPDVDADGHADLLLGASRGSIGVVNSGRTFLYSGRTGQVLKTITPDVPDIRMGLVARVVGDHDGDGLLDYLVAGTGGGTSGPPPGRFFVVAGGETPLGLSYCTSTPNSASATGSQIEAFGTAGLASNRLRLTAQTVPASVPGLFFVANQQVSVPFGDGVLCAAGQTARLAQAFSDANGVAMATVDNTVFPATLLNPGTWNFQFWHRDPAGGPAGFNTSNAVAVTFAP